MEPTGFRVFVTILIMTAALLLLFFEIRRRDRSEREKTELLKEDEASRKEKIEAEMKFFSVDKFYLETHDICNPATDLSPQRRLLFDILRRALEEKAWFFSIQPFEDSVRVRGQRGQVWRDIYSYPLSLHKALSDEINLFWFGEDDWMWIIPATGVLTLKYPSGNWVDLFVNTLPGTRGPIFTFLFQAREKRFEFDLDHLGFDRGDLEAVKKAVDSESGLLIFAGPTGSGKSAACYSSLKRRLGRGDVITTLERPRKFPLSGARQIVIESGDDYGAMIPVALENNPQVLMMQEIFAYVDWVEGIRAARSRLVIAGLHAPDVFTTISRLYSMLPNMTAAKKGDVEAAFRDRDEAVSVIQLIGSGRLVRTLCPDCRTAIATPSEVFGRSGMNMPEGGKIETFSGRGCDQCYGRGFAGRIGVHEVLLMSAEMRRLIAGEAPFCALIRQARSEGMVSMREAAMKLAMKGVTSVQEALSATPLPYYQNKSLY